MTKSMKRMVLTGAAVAVMMSFAAPAMAVPKVVDGGPGVIGPVVDPPDPPDPPDPLCDVRPYGCGNTPDPVLDPGDNPVAEPPPPPPPAPPPDDTTPPDDATPPDDTPPPDNKDPRNEESDTSGSGGSSGGSSGGAIDSASETIDRGGTFVSSFLPTTLTSTIGDVGNSMKKNLPAPVAKSLPNTGGGWSFLVLVAAGLIAGGFLIRSIARRTASVTRTGQ